ncbi:MAG TPA: amino acid adenylation domain-containing protein [Gemmatimonadaceae bacterium]
MSRLLQQYVSDQAQRRPNAGAVVFKGELVTYAWLEQASNRLAHVLRAVGVRGGDRVCLVMPKGLEAMVAIQAVLKADAIYVPLDAASPAPRLRKMIDVCDDRWIIGCGSAGPLINTLFADVAFAATHSLGWLGGGEPPQDVAAAFDMTDVSAQSDHLPPSHRSSAEAAHILFTSGSTGTPKGVVITHDNVRHFVQWALSEFGTAPGDRISGHPPLHFDLSTFDIFGTFAAGAELHLVPAELNLLPNKVAAFIRDSRLTQWFSVPTTLNMMAKADVVRPGDFPGLKRLLWCGEVLPTSSLMYWMQRLPHVTFTNLYGPTEATIASSYYRVPSCPVSAEEEIPIGAPCRGEELLVLDEDLHATPPGVEGDLYIGGVGLSPGYWRDDQRSGQQFIPNPGGGAGDRIYRTGDRATVGPDGLFRCRGRSDFQIKTRGYRIDVGEIETALHALGMLRECAVVGVASGGVDGTTICCGYVPLVRGAASPADIRTALGRSLPSYMLPSRWRELDAVPRTSNGKVDRRSLMETFLDEPAVVG